MLHAYFTYTYTVRSSYRCLNPTDEARGKLYHNYMLIINISCNYFRSFYPSCFFRVIYYRLLYVSAIGCPNPLLEHGVQMKRVGEEATFTCNNTSNTWSLTCESGRWIGRQGSCAEGKKKHRWCYLVTILMFPASAHYHTLI